MTTAAPMQETVPRPRSAWALAGSGILVASAGGMWWAWDADPDRGKILLIVGLLVALAGILIRRRAVAVPARAVTVAAVVLVLLAGFEIWQAISTIVEQGAAHAT